MRDQPSGQDGPPSEWLIRGQGLTKSFGSTRALAGCDVDIRRGEVLAITGPSGSGKSTLLHCLAGIMMPDSGDVTLRERSLGDLSDSERAALRRTSFGFVFQFGQLVPELSALENAALPLLLNRTRRRVALARAKDWLEKFGVGGMGSRRPGELSGGQAQRVAIARAMAVEPQIIFADEPTGSLDSESGTLVLDALTSASREHDVAVVIVTHDRHVASYADREIVVRDGIASPRHVPDAPEAVGGRS
ncbi:ABC transporter ATP-binding protein [Polymorphospora sp. NPDC051019]|uniref:ABC transporter ATP-binding protein n=1 Tax=Polymorphospora sp. NPDC051019 TaxID=3155725 RepID=UPI003426AB46